MWRGRKREAMTGTPPRPHGVTIHHGDTNHTTICELTAATAYGQRMTDNLRTRIAAVICDMDALHAKQWSLAVADAVIRELNLREERRYPNRLPHYTFMPPQRTRYVTEWKS